MVTLHKFLHLQMLANVPITFLDARYHLLSATVHAVQQYSDTMHGADCLLQAALVARKVEGQPVMLQCMSWYDA